MHYKQFLESSERHEITCDILISSIDSTVNDHHIYSNILYLSGYVIECYLKFKILEINGINDIPGKNPTKDEKLNIKNIIGCNFFIHDLNTLMDVVRNQLTDDILSDIDQDELSELLSKWGAHYRYTKPEICDAKKFYGYAKKIKKIIR